VNLRPSKEVLERLRQKVEGAFSAASTLGLGRRSTPSRRQTQSRDESHEGGAAMRKV
jgi:hypothetical protein